MDVRTALGSGLVGACTLTLVHEVGRRLLPHAPRLDVLGRRALTRVFSMVGSIKPDPTQLHTIALAGDIVTNTLYYSLVGVDDNKRPLLRGALLGGIAGVGAILAPGPLGLGRQSSARTPATQVMTIAWYIIGGLAAAATWQRFGSAEGGTRVQ